MKQIYIFKEVIDMKKALKTVGKIGKGYLVFNTLSLAFIGAARIIDESYDNPKASIYETDWSVFENSCKSWKRLWMSFKIGVLGL